MQRSDRGSKSPSLDLVMPLRAQEAYRLYAGYRPRLLRRRAWQTIHPLTTNEPFEASDRTGSSISPQFENSASDRAHLT